MGGGKGGDTGPTANQTEAYQNFGSAGGQYDTIDQTPGYGDWAAANPGLTEAANMGFSEGKSAADQMAHFQYMMQRPAELQANRDYQSGIYGTLGSKEASFSDIAEADLRFQRMGTEDESGYDNFAGTLAGQYGEGFGYVWDPDQEYTGAKDMLGGSGQGAWRAVGQSEFDTLAGDREGTMANFGGLRNAAGDDIWGGWETAVEGEGLRDQAIGAYQDALGFATNTVNSAIDQERQNALLMGVDYDLTDASKATRISDQLASDDRWTDSMQSDLDKLMTDFGAGGFEQGIFRGAGTAAAAGGTTTATLDSSRPTAASTVLTDEEDTLGSTTLLGA